MTKHAIAPEVLRDNISNALGELAQHVDLARAMVWVRRIFCCSWMMP